METRICTARYDGPEPGVADALIRQLQQQLEGATPAFTMVFAARRYPLRALQSALRERLGGGPVLGTTSAGEFTAEGDTQNGAVAVAVAGDFVVHAGMGRGLQTDAAGALRAASASFPAAVDGHPFRTVLMLTDTLVGNTEEVVELASRQLGTRVRLAGGGASDSMVSRLPELGLDHETGANALVLAAIFSRKPLGVGVHHGHTALSRTLKVTQAKANVVLTLNGEPAWSVWKQHTREHARQFGLDPDRIRDFEAAPYLLRYEAGLQKGSEYIVRAPIAVSPEGGLVFTSRIPEGTELRIMESRPERQVSSARAAARLARIAGGGTPAGAIVFDCICRKLILKDDFRTAVAGISEELGRVPVAGFETFGEIALDAGDLSGFHATTTVVLSFPR